MYEINSMIDKINFDKMGGLVPAIVQDASTGVVLMTGFMNPEALTRTLDEKEVVFWSRTKQRLWKKGETSGHVLAVESITTDCDNDAVLILAHPAGPACHTGAQSCFGEDIIFRDGIVRQLAGVIHQRKQEMPAGSYTTKLFSDGIARIAQKVGEEAVEVSIAAQYTDRKRIVEESADLMYHLLVLLEEKGIALDEVMGELAKRRGKAPAEMQK